MAQLQWLGISLIGLLGFSGSAAVGLSVGIPEARVHDEFSYLLAADTFASGRLSNPTHPMWMHFESMHIFHEPTYMSKYPPGQGLMLAAGQLLGGHPIFGVWMSVGLMSAAICWMLYAWVPPSWALMGGVLALIHPGMGMHGYWAQSYWGGAVAATGGALLFGALRRILRQPRKRHAMVMGLGLAVLANSRPYEGLIVSVLAVIVLLAWMVMNGPISAVLTRNIFVPILIVMTLTGTAMGFYNFSVTGNVFRMPYQVHQEKYGPAPPFLSQPPRPNLLHHNAVVDRFQKLQLEGYTAQHSISGFLKKKKKDFQRLWDFYFGTVFIIPLLAMSPIMVPWVSRNRWAFFAVFTCSVLVVGFLLTTWLEKHYAAPIAGLTLFFVLQAMRLWRWRDRIVGRFVLWFVVLFCVYSYVRSFSGTFDVNSSAWHQDRARIIKQLEKNGGRHLLIVRYGPRHSVHNEWVYNKADINSAKVVLAHDIDRAQNRKLVEYFDDRQVWLLEVDWDDSGPKVKPYS
jgi:hypothetical protein